MIHVRARLAALHEELEHKRFACKKIRLATCCCATGLLPSTLLNSTAPNCPRLLLFRLSFCPLPQPITRNAFDSKIE